MREIAGAQAEALLPFTRSFPAIIRLCRPTIAGDDLCCAQHNSSADVHGLQRHGDVYEYGEMVDLFRFAAIRKLCRELCRELCRQGSRQRPGTAGSGIWAFY